MLLLTFKHIIADFVLQNSWMAIGKDQKTGWALPLLAHCLVHLAVAMLLILIIAPKFWFVAVDRFRHPHHRRPRQGTLRLDLRRDAGADPWFWTLIGVDQALHHLTGFGLSIFMAANADPAGFTERASRIKTLRLCSDRHRRSISNPAQPFIKARTSAVARTDRSG